MVLLIILIVNAILKNIKSISRNVVWLIQSIFTTLILVLILFTPSMIYVYLGGTSTDMEFVCRGLGFLLCLFSFLYIMRK